MSGRIRTTPSHGDYAIHVTYSGYVSSFQNDRREEFILPFKVSATLDYFDPNFAIWLVVHAYGAKKSSTLIEAAVYIAQKILSGYWRSHRIYFDRDISQCGFDSD